MICSRLVVASLMLSVTGCSTWSNSEKRLATTIGSSLLCGFAGHAMASGEDDDPEKSAFSSAAVCAYAGDVASEYLFPSPSEKKLRNLEAKNDQYEGLLTRHGISLSTPQIDRLGAGKVLPPSQVGGGLSDLVLEGCQVVEYKIGFDQDSVGLSGFIPVNGQVVIQSFKYYLVVPKDGSNRNCVRPHAAFGYLNREFKNLPEILIDKAKRSK